MYDARFAAIEEKLDRLRQMMPPEIGTFMNADYMYGLPMNTVATETQISDWECKNACTLPDDYRAFISHVGDGGPGYGGLKALCTENNQTGSPSAVACLCPFPFVWQPEVDEETGEALGSLFATSAEIRDTFHRPDHALEVFCEGCDVHLFLVLSGEERAHIWMALTESENSSRPLQLPGKPRVSFLEWFESWLDGVLNQAVKAHENGVPVWAF